ncbi:MAG: phage tail protein [Oscillospiraceae bacterium]
MGTPAAVNRIIETIFETGYIEEWYEYDGEPHHFRAYVGDGGEVGRESWRSSGGSCPLSSAFPPGWMTLSPLRSWIPRS